MSTRTWLTPLIGTITCGLLLAPSLSCKQLECAEGTIEQDGTCRAADSDPDDAVCGVGTELVDGKCEPVFPPTVCEDGTTVATVDPETGVTVCQGVGGGGCDSNRPCPSAGPNKVTVCGRFYNVENDQLIQAADPQVAECGTASAATDGPCALDLKFYDALDFAGNPQGAVPLAVESLYVDDCGRYVATNISRPQLGFLGVGVDDKSGAPDTYELTGVAFPVSSGAVRNNTATYVMQKSTNTNWSSMVGLSPTFVQRGVFASVYLYRNMPVEDVTITDSNGARPNDDYYFTNTEATLRTLVTATGPTGPNGTALILNSSLVEHSGSGGEPSGCQWPSDLAASVPGLMFFNPRHAETPAGADCP